MKNRLIATLHVLCMVLTLLSGTARAADSKSLPADEYERAIHYGFAAKQGDPNRLATEAEFTGMLSAMIRAYKPEKLAQFEGLSYVQEAGNSRVFRFYAAILLLYAAEAIDCVELPDGMYPTVPMDLVESGEWDWSKYWYTDWDATDGWTEETFSEISEAMTKYSDKPMSHYHGGVDFAVSCLSRVNGKPLLDFDSVNYMRQNDHLTYREGAVAVLRLFESIAENAALVIDFSAADKWEEGFLRDVEARKQSILTNQESLPCEGTAYYLSNSGSDENDGKSPEHAWATLKRVDQAKLEPGDVVYLERGGLWRGSLVCDKGVSLSAYGTGEKPKIYGSTENGAGAENWILFHEDSSGKKIWKYRNEKMSACGCGIILGDTNTIARRIYSWYDEKAYYFLEDRTTPFDMLKALDRDLTFYCEPVPDHYKGSTIYLRCDSGNPGERYDSIEFLNQEGNENWETVIITANQDCTIDNLCIMYFADIGIEVLNGASGVTIQNCEIQYGGGSILWYKEPTWEGDASLYINGQGIFVTESDALIQNNYIHDIYECSVNFEICRPYEDIKPYLPYSNSVIRENLFARCGLPITVTNNSDPQYKDAGALIDNLLIEDNWIMDAGFGWYAGRQTGVGDDPDMQKMIFNTDLRITFDGSDCIRGPIKVSNNIFYRGLNELVGLRNEDDSIMSFSNNTFAQKFGELVLWHQDNGVEAAAPELTQERVNNICGTNAGKVVILQPDFKIADVPAAPARFTDVAANAYYADAVSWAVEKKVTAGITSTTFAPGQDCTNAQILTFLYRANGEPSPKGSNPFVNVSKSDFYYNAALWAYETGMVTGTSFDADKPCTRAMTVTYLWQAAGSPKMEASAGFTDVSTDADYAQAVVWAVGKKVTAGATDTTFAPEQVCSRGQIVTFLHRAYA